MGRLPQSRVRLASWHETTIYAVVGLLMLSGIAWLACHFFFPQQGLLGPMPNRYEGLWLKVHGAAAMLALFFFGSLLTVHMLRAWALRRNRISGGLMSAFVLLLTLTGYGLYYIADDQLRAWTSLAHWVPGLLLPLLLFTHVLLGQNKMSSRRRRTRNSAEPSAHSAATISSSRTSDARHPRSTIH